MGFLGGIETATPTTTAATELQEIKLVGLPFMATTSNNNNNNSNSVSHDSPSSSTSKTTNHHHHHNHYHHQSQFFPHPHNQQHQQPHNISYAMMQSTTPPPSSSSSLPLGNYIGGRESSGAYDLGELDQALFLYFDGQAQADLHEHRQNPNPSSASAGGGGAAGAGGMSLRPPTLNIFPSQPMHVEPSSKTSLGGVQSASGGSKRPSEEQQQQQQHQPPMELSNNNNNNTNNKMRNQNDHHHAPAEPSKCVKREGNRKGPTSSSEQEGPKTPDPKTLRRLAQNREAARKSRLRKKAYVQQLESSRIRLAQLEQELQRARAQGIFFGGGGTGEQGIPLGVTNISSDAAVFDLEYTRWLEEHHRLTCELRAAVQEHLPETELKIYVDNCLAHYDVVMNLKGLVAKTDVFHLVSGMWKTPAENLFLPTL